MTEPIPIVPDTPTSNPRLGFTDYVSALSDAVRGVTPPQLTIGIYGPWGSGKTSLLRAIAASLEQVEHVIPVLFDAWRYEGQGPIIVPLLYRILTSLGPHEEMRLRDQIKKTIRALIASSKIVMPGFEIEPSKVMQAAPNDELAALDIAFARPYEELSQLSSKLGTKRLCVLIDDLDRCSPQHLVASLEAINLILDIPGIVFVVALDYEVLVEAISSRYPHVSGHVFIEKLIQLPFRVPPQELQGHSYIEALIPRETLAYLPTGFEVYAHDIIVLALGSNTRRIKRFVNSFLLVLRIAERRRQLADDELLAAIVGLQLGWPVEHSALARAFQEGDEVTIISQESEDPHLARYKERFFKNVEIKQFEEIFRLTQAVQTPLHDITWKTAARASDIGGVEVGAGGGRVIIRDTKNPGSATPIDISLSDWKAFLDGVKSGGLDAL